MKEAEALFLLGFSTRPSTEEVKQRFHKLARENHPDRTGRDTSEHMARVLEAYQVLQQALPPVSEPVPKRQRPTGSTFLSALNSSRVVCHVTYEILAAGNPVSVKYQRRTRGAEDKSAVVTVVPTFDRLTVLVAGAGHYGTDLCLDFTPETHPVYKFRQKMLYMHLPVRLEQAFGNFRKIMTSFQGDTYELRIPQHLRHGDILRVAASGYKRFDGSVTDLFIQVQMQMPEKLTHAMVDEANSPLAPPVLPVRHAIRCTEPPAGTPGECFTQ